MLALVIARAASAPILLWRLLQHLWVAYGPEGVRKFDLHVPHVLTPFGGLIGEQCRQDVRVFSTVGRCASTSPDLVLVVKLV